MPVFYSPNPFPDPMPTPLAQRLTDHLDQFRREGVYKRLNHLETPQAARVRMAGRGEVIILSSNNYLGLSNQPEVVAAGKAGEAGEVILDVAGTA